MIDWVCVQFFYVCCMGNAEIQKDSFKKWLTEYVCKFFMWAVWEMQKYFFVNLM